MKLYEDIIRYVDAEIAALQEAKKLLLSGMRSPAETLTLESVEEEVAESQAEAAPARTPAVKAAKAVKAVRRVMKPRVAPTRRIRKTQVADGALSSALTHIVPSGPVAVSPEAVRRAQEKAIAASMPPAIAAMPELSEELLRKKWTMQ